MSGRHPDMPQRVIVVTGMNGAGKTTALKAFEDLGYEAIDNMPLSLVMRLLATGKTETEEPRPLAIGVDFRTRDFRVERFLAQYEALHSRSDLDLHLLFLDCDDATLLQRFSETRRRHPLAPDRPLQDGIAREREALAPLRRRADFVFDTTGQTVHDLKRRLTGRYRIAGFETMAITVMSFGFARGVPRDADLVFDVRFLRNPNFVPELKPLTGRDERVADHVAADPAFAGFFDRLESMALYLLPLYKAEGKSYLTIACGCTGGRHRSVFTAELLGRMLARHGWRADILHRDVDAAGVRKE